MDETIDQTLAGTPRRPTPQRLSAVLGKLAEEADGPITIAHIRSVLGDRSFSTLLLFFALLNLLPLPPPSSAILGLPLLIISSQMIWGNPTVWLPKRVLDISLTPEQFRVANAKINPWLSWVEKYIRPRYGPFWPKQGERVVGVMALLLGTVVTLPIPLGNWLPAFSTALLAFALTERDGILLCVGSAVGVAALAVIGAVIGSAGALIGYVWSHAGMWF